MIRKHATILAGLIAPALLAGVAGCSRPDAAPANQEYLHRVAALKLERASEFEVEREFAGLVVAAQSTDIGFELPGQVEQLLVDEGDVVARGQALAVQDSRLLTSERNDLSARRGDLEARLKLNRLNTERARELKEKGFTATQRLDELEAERRSLEAGLDQLDAALASNRTRLDKATIKAPYAATIARRFVDQGAVVAGGTPVFRLLESAQLEARVGVPVRLLGSLRLGEELPLRVGEDEQLATVIGISRDVTRATLTVPVRLALSATVDAVAGDQAYLRLVETVDQAGYWVPLEALTDGLRGLWNVYVLRPLEDRGGEVLEARDVRVLHATAAEAFIDGALTDGERIVATGLHRLVPGQRVRTDDLRQLTRHGS